MLRAKVAWVPLGLSLVGACLGLGCANDDAAEANRDVPFGAGNSGGTTTIGGTSAATGGIMVPPEEDTTLDLVAPQAAENYVYAISPATRSVVLIDAKTLAVETVPTGRAPDLVRVLAGSDDAIILDRQSSDAVLVHVGEDGPTVQPLKTVDGANAVSVSPGGEYAVAYFRVADAEPGQALGELQGVSVLFLSGDEVVTAQVSVGLRPREVVYSADGQTGFVVTEGGISRLDFAAIADGSVGIAPEVSFGDQRVVPSDVSVTSDGRFAVGFDTGAAVVRLVDLEDGTTHALDLGAGTEDADAGMGDGPVITDLDLAEDGSFALIVLGDEGQVLRVPLPDGFADESKVDRFDLDDSTFSQARLFPDGSRALLYSTSIDEERVVLLDLSASAEPTYVDVRKGVRSVGVSPAGDAVVIVHQVRFGDPLESGISADTRLDREHAYTLLRPETGFALIRTTPVDPMDLAIVPDGSQLVMTFRGDGVREVHRVDLFSFQRLPVIQLQHAPLSMGLVAGSQRIYVQQEDEAGAISFIDWQTGELRTVSGYELNSGIRE